jgi:hypothetical protein
MNYIDTKPVRLCTVCGHDNEIGSNRCRQCNTVLILSTIGKAIYKNLGLDKQTIYMHKKDRNERD